MRRDPELVRAILIGVTEADGDPIELKVLEFDDYTNEEVSYHIEILCEGGYLTGQNLTTAGGYHWVAQRLTWAGNDLLDSIRDDGVWAKTLAASRKAGGWTVPILQAVATKIIMSRLDL